MTAISLPYSGVAATTPATPISLRPYQTHDLEEIRTAFRSHRSVLLVQPTGAGKGTLASYIVHSAVARGRKVLFLVNRRALVHDFSKRLDRLGIDHGVIMGNHPRRKPWLSTHVASIDTLHRRERVPKADLLVIDEARFAVSPTWAAVIAKYPNAKILGMDATPIRIDGRGLGEIFEYMVKGPAVSDLIGQGFLVPSRVFAPAAPDVSGVKKTGGDFNQGALSAACDRAKLVGGIVEHWKRLASDRKTVVFGVDQKHAQHIAEEFRCAGIHFAYVDANTPDEARDKMWADFDEGSLQGIVSVGVISFGWDRPICSCVVMARPTDSLSVHMQQIGRGSRPHKLKSDLLVLDHAGNTHRHGFYETPREWSLEGRAIGKAKDEDALSISTCRVCYATFKSGPPACPYCGAVIQKNSRTIEVEEGQLEELRREQKAAAIEEWQGRQSESKMRLHFEQLVRLGNERGYSKNWARVKMRAIYGRWVPASWHEVGTDDVTYTDPSWEESAKLLADIAANRGTA